MSSRWSRLSVFRNLELSLLRYGTLLSRIMLPCVLSFYESGLNKHTILLQAQYRLLFEAVAVFLESFDNYCNF